MSGLSREMHAVCVRIDIFIHLLGARSLCRSDFLGGPAVTGLGNRKGQDEGCPQPYISVGMLPWGAAESRRPDHRLTLQMCDRGLLTAVLWGWHRCGAL